MPELPEVETVVRDLQKNAVGKRIVSAWLDVPNLLKGITPTRFKKEIARMKIAAVSRRGKYILVSLTRAGQKEKYLLLAHLKMTGHFLYGKWEYKGGKWVNAAQGVMQEWMNNYIHLVFTLDNGKMLAFSDVRKFGRISFGKEEEILAIPELKMLGLEPFDRALTTATTHAKLKKRKRAIKSVLLDQSVMAGLGNIYADDVLWHAQVHPKREASTLTDEEVKKIIKGARIILKKSINRRGASMNTYRDLAGEAGKYGPIRLAYQRTGLPCYRCETPIARMVISGRSSHYCPQCQII